MNAQPISSESLFEIAHQYGLAADAVLKLRVHIAGSAADSLLKMDLETPPWDAIAELASRLEALSTIESGLRLAVSVKASEGTSAGWREARSSGPIHTGETLDLIRA